MKEVKNTGHARQVNAYFHQQASRWQDIYSAEDVEAVAIRDRHDTVLQWIDQLDLPAGTRVLEVGCGAGFLSLAERGFQVQAIDSVETMIEQTRSNAANCEISGQISVEIGDVYALRFEVSSFDLVLAVGVISWLEHIDRAVHEMVRVLKPGGYLLLTNDNWGGLTNHCDPMLSPLLAPLKVTVKNALIRVGVRKPTPVLRFSRRKTIDRILARAQVVKSKGQTRGFSFSFFRHSLPNPLGTAIHRRFQSLADRGVPVLRAVGETYLVLARKEEDLKEKP